MKDEKEKEQRKPKQGKGRSRNGKGHNSKGSKGGKPNDHKENPTNTEYADKRDFSSDSNDVKWWLPSGITAQQVASYPWNTMAGFDIAQSIAGAKGVQHYTAEANNLPGIMRIVMQSTFPLSTGESSALNRASLGLFADILTKNSSNVPFEHTDLMMSMFAFSDIDSWLCKGIRAYALLKHYPVQNKYLAKTLVESCGFDYESLIRDPYAFISRLNIYISRRNRFYIPKTFAWRDREMWLSQAVYKDSDDMKSQFYVFDKDSYSVWSPRTNENGSELRQFSASEVYDWELTVDEYFSLLDKMLEPLENDQDIYIMQGYLLKRYEVSDFAVFPYVDASTQIIPVIDYPVLTMIQNMKLYESYDLDQNSEYTPLTQSGGHFVYEPKFYTHFTNTGNILLTSCYNDPTPDQTIEATRLILPIQPEVETQGEHDYVLCTPSALNADVVRLIRFYTLDSAGEKVVFSYTAREFSLVLDELTPKGYYLITNISYFDFHPILPVLATAGANNVYDFLGFMGDFDNTMILTQENLHKLNDVLTYGIVNVVQPIK